MENVELDYQDIYTRRLPSVVGWLYFFSIICVLAMLITSFFIKLDVSVIASGIIRPALERTAVKSGVTGIIDTIYAGEGEFVRKGSRLARLRSPELAATSNFFKKEIVRKKLLLADIKQILNKKYPDSRVIMRLQTELLVQQYHQFIKGFQQLSAFAYLKEKEHRRASVLVAEKIISRSEYEIRESEWQQANAAKSAFVHTQMSVWNAEATRLEQELGSLNYESELNDLNQELYELKAPVAGVVMGIRKHYENNMIQSGEVICQVSPEDSLVLECFVDPGDIGFLHPEQAAGIRLDAFNSKDFGTIRGKIIAIDNDFTEYNGKHFFMVRCRLSASGLALRNGYTVKIKKGLTAQVRFIISRRTVWQLLFDKLDDWLDPATSI